MARSPYRWVVLGAFLLVAGLSQAVWLNFAPLVPLVQQRYGVSEDAAGVLILVFPAMYVLLSIPAGILTDRHGYRYALRLAAGAMFAFSLLRVIDGGFALLLLSQIGLAAAQPFAVNAISKLVIDWFEPEQRALATGLGTMGMFIGMAVGIAATPPMVDAWGLPGSMAVWAGISGVISLATFAGVRERSERVEGADQAGLGEIRALLKDRSLVLTFLIAGLGLGYFNGITTWLEPILAPNGLNADQAGVVGGVLILGGIVGAGAIPALSDALHRRKPFVLGSVAAALATFWPLVASHDYRTVLLGGALQGFFFLPAFALLLQICSELAGEARAGAATGVLMLVGNAGGVAVIVAMSAAKDATGSWTMAAWTLPAVLAIAGAGAAMLPETGRASSRT